MPPVWPSGQHLRTCAWNTGPRVLSLTPGVSGGSYDHPATPGDTACAVGGREEKQEVKALTQLWFGAKNSLCFGSELEPDSFLVL